MATLTCTGRGTHSKWKLHYRPGTENHQMIIRRTDGREVDADTVDAATLDIAAVDRGASAEEIMRDRAAMTCKRCGRHYALAKIDILIDRADTLGVSEVDLSTLI